MLKLSGKKQKIASYGVGPKKTTERHVYIASQTNHVNLGFYHGASATDASGLLEGIGKRLRHIKIYTLKDVESSELKSL